MRDNNWLRDRLEFVWQNHFQDVPIANQIHVSFGRRAKKRLGSTRHEKVNQVSRTRIKLNGHYRDPRVPEYVIDATLAHEICHYVHGFSSPLPQVFDHPHRGDVVEKEIIERGMKNKLILQRSWLEKNWNMIVEAKIF